MPLLESPYEHWLAIAGWSAVLILWHSTIVALALAAWRTWWRRASATAQYRAGLLALLVCIVFAAGTPIALVAVPLGPAAAGPTVAAPADGATARSSAVSPPAAPVIYQPEVRSMVAWIGLLWLVASVVALARLAGGWALACWIRRRATAVAPDTSDASIAEVSRSWRLPRAALLASAHVDAPVVLGHWAPAILLPSDAARHLDADAMAPLLAHELAHVARSDYAVNVAHSIAEALLVFSPAVHWIASRIREAREYCCDDLVAARYGPRPYADALATLARLGATPRARPALNVAGPRLIVRIRRLLEADAMTPFPTARLTGLAVVLVLAAIAGSRVVPLSAAAVAQAPALAVGGIPFAFPLEQDGASVTLRSFERAGDRVCGTATIQNQADVPLTSVRFAAVLSAMGEGKPLFVGFSPAIPVTVAPGETVRVDANLVGAQNLPTRPVRGQVQASCMLAQARFANGYEWGIDPIEAQAIDIRFRFPKIDVPRSIVGAASASGDAGFCVDDSGRTFSRGAIVGVRNEPGRFARCVDGRWDGR